MSNTQGLPNLPPVNMAPGRSCAGCTLCCKVLTLPELKKPAQQWCKHCDVSAGCKIHDTKPDVCTIFYCQYRIDAGMPEPWKPSECHMVLHFEPDHNRLVVHVDSDYPNAWQTQPYYGQLKSWGLAMIEQGGLLIVWQGPNAVAVLPDKDVNLGPTKKDHIYLTLKTSTFNGIRYDVESVHKSDPRAKGL